MYASEASSTVGSVETHVDPAELYLSRIPHLTRKPDDDMGAAFAERQMIHFAKVLGEKWACPREGHNICVKTEDGGHHELSDDNITAWVAALCGGEATTSQPPLNVLLSFVPSAPAPNSPSAAPGSPALRAVPRSRRRYNSNASTNAPYPDLDDADSLFLAPSERESTVLGDEWAHDSPVVPGDGDTRPRERVGANVPPPTRDPTPTLSPIPPLSPMSTMSRLATASSSSPPTTNGNAHSRAGSGDSLTSATSATPTPPERERDVWSPYASFLPSITDGEADDGQSPSEERQLQPVQEEEEAEEQYEDSAHSVPSTPNTPGSAAPLTPPTADRASHWDVDSQYGTSFARSRPRSEGSDFYYDAAAARGVRADALGLPGGGEDGPLLDEASRWSSQEFEVPVAQGNGVTTEGKKKPFRWFGGKAAVQTSSVTKRANAHVARIKKWQKAAAAYASASDASHGKNGKNGAGKGGAKGKGKGKGGAGPAPLHLALTRAEREAVSEMMADALEMARPSHPPRLHKLAYTIGRDVQQFLTVVLQAMEEGAYGGDESDDADGAELQLLLIQVQICLIPVLLTYIAHTDPPAAALAHRLIGALTRAPSALADPDMAAVTIRLVSRELAYCEPEADDLVPASPVGTTRSGGGSGGKAAADADADMAGKHCTKQHTWLGVDLLRIVEMVVALRALTEGEQVAIWELALRRRGQGDNIDTSRPWEVALFALCACQNAWFKDAVLGPTGLDSLVSALDEMIDPAIPLLDVNWENVALTLRALAFLSEHDWVARAVEETIVRSLLGVFSIPERWFCIRFWAMDTIRNILSHRPPLVSTLVRENAAVAFATLACPTTPITPNSVGSRSPSSSVTFPPAAGASPTTPNKRSPSPGLGTTSSKTGARVMEDYKREASKRAEELTAYIRNWTQWKPYLVRLEPVSIGNTF